MEQLGLHLANRLSYASKNFCMHEGVRDCLTAAFTVVTSKQFSICYIVGAPRFGKTHCSIKISDSLVEREYLPRLVEGEDFQEWLSHQAPRLSFTALDRIIVDDADRYLTKILPGQSGPFVNLIETLRRASAGIVLLSSTPMQELPCDEHVMSRLIPGTGYIVGTPGEDDMESLIKLMAEQRGIKLKESKIGFLIKRLRRDIPSIEDYFERVSHLSRVLGQRIRFPLLGDAIDRNNT